MAASKSSSLSSVRPMSFLRLSFKLLLDVRPVASTWALKSPILSFRARMALYSDSETPSCFATCSPSPVMSPPVKAPA
ncbi:MAG: hypothetical protein BWY99_02197 [Synergistetes bacterium ADurb.BinA166]|nr:MAG: hypothetical protein BWY99_02197 [Synergistetes bacterium ADurb.BinA166]